MVLHGLEEFDHDLGARADEHLPLATLLSVVDRLERVREGSHTSHGAAAGSGREPGTAWTETTPNPGTNHKTKQGWDTVDPSKCGWSGDSKTRLIGNCAATAILFVG